MINHETVAFIGMLNELSWRSQDNVFVPIRDRKFDKYAILCDFVCSKVFYDVDILQHADNDFVYFRIIKYFGKDKYVYYPHAFVAIPRDSKEHEKCIVVFADEDWNEEKEFMVYNGHWHYVED